MPDFSYMQITSGLADAIRVWSDYLTGQRNLKQWGPFGAREFFLSEFSTYPKQPATARQLAAIAQLGSWAEDPTLLNNPRAAKKLPAAMAAASSYLWNELDLNLTNSDTGVQPSKTTLDDAVNKAQAVYTAPSAAAAIDFPSPSMDPTANYVAMDAKLSSASDASVAMVLESLKSEYDEPPPSLFQPDLVGQQTPDATIDGKPAGI